MLFIAPVLSFAQETVKEHVFETEMSKDAIFQQVKMFVVDSWVNPNNSILNEDKENGIIQLKTDKDIAINVGMGLQCVYEYEYRVKIRMKDGKCKIEFYDVICKDAQQVGMGNNMDVPQIPYFEGNEPPVKTTKMGRGVNAKKAVEVMNELRSEFETITELLGKSLQKDDDF
jgi:hypothetical protein